MGRYYSGDIEGKFWFGVQSSTDATFFGGEEYEPNYINYYFNKSHIDDIKKGIETCKKELGKYRKKLDRFFSKKSMYTNSQLVDNLGIKENELRPLLKWYARLGLGEKILKCVKKKGKCSFKAEL